MKNNIYGVGRKIGYILLIFFSSIFSYSQFTPARGTFVVTPPYPNKLSDYGNPNLLKMNATITATDPSFTSKPIRLKLSIFYNQQLLMQGNDMVVGERPMYLTMGQMLILTQADLAPYFQQQNMRVSPVQYSQTMREGFYQFQLDILDYYSLQKIGLPLVASIYIMRYDPPQLYKPENKAVLMDKGQGLIQFQWNPRQIAPNTEYEFTLVELQQEKFVDPAIEFTARRAGSYYYKTTTRMNTLNYGMMGEMPLRWGKSYAWQVRAMTREGMDQVGTYEQDGYTDIRSFTYQKYCPVPTNIGVDVKSSEEATYTWDAAPEHTSFILKITAADNPENTWLSVYPQEAKFEETQYRPDITYFYKLQGVCGEGKSEESGERSFTMLPKGQIKNFKCNEGDGTESTGFETIANQKLLERDLQVGDTFTYSNWCKIAVKSVEKVGGYYKGKGVYRMPLAMFGFPLINIIFDSITVNTDLVALSGGFEAVNRGMKGVADVDDAVNVGRDLVSNVQDIVQDVKQLVEDVKQELNALLETLQAGKKPTVEELETAKKGIDNLVVEGKKTLEELKKNPEENKEQIAKMEEAITKLESCSKCVDDHAKANKEEEQKKKEEATAKPGPNRYEIYNAYAIVAAECQLENELKNAVNAADVVNKNIANNKNVSYFIVNSKKYNSGDTIYLRQDVSVKVEAYKPNGKAFEKIVLNGKEQGKSFEYKPDNSNSFYAIEAKDGDTILQCKLVAPTISMQTDIIDDNKIEAYPTYNTFNKLPIIGLLQGNNMVKFNITPDISSQIKMTKNKTIFEIQKPFANKEIGLKPTSQYGDSYLSNDVSNEKIKEPIIEYPVINYAQCSTRTVQIYLLYKYNGSQKTKQTFGFNTAEIENRMNELYKPTGITFKVLKTFIDVDINYSKDMYKGEYYLTLDNTNELDPITSEETTRILNYIDDKYKQYTADYRVIIIPEKSNLLTIDGNTPAGMGAYKDNYIAKFYKSLILFSGAFVERKIKNNKDMGFLWAHEIGHSGFALEHPFEEFRNNGYPQPRIDMFNFMDYNVDILDQQKSRAYQWEQIFNNDKIKFKVNENNTNITNETK